MRTATSLLSMQLARLTLSGSHLPLSPPAPVDPYVDALIDSEIDGTRVIRGILIPRMSQATTEKYLRLAEVTEMRAVYLQYRRLRGPTISVLEEAISISNCASTVGCQ